MKKIERINFSKYYGENYYFYRFSRYNKKYELCLEPCLNGYCVALYESFDDEYKITPVIIMPKKCTKMNYCFIDFMNNKDRPKEVWDKAINYANQMLKIYFERKVDKNDNK